MAVPGGSTAARDQHATSRPPHKSPGMRAARSSLRIVLTGESDHCCHPATNVRRPQWLAGLHSQRT
jgi:hypothetical protein